MIAIWGGQGCTCPPHPGNGYITVSGQIDSDLHVYSPVGKAVSHPRVYMYTFVHPAEGGTL